ncbi:hypothetical protein Ciccas_010009 [Cichlidogyrus casuarinus]|uniref:RecQ-mediated genome instability protein 1 n=1 Tax=Cichlidogyrus casuarinus TaxID=1844966 RepID=A0ABD2PX96_9PLAT
MESNLALQVVDVVDQNASLYSQVQKLIGQTLTEEDNQEEKGKSEYYSRNYNPVLYLTDGVRKINVAEFGHNKAPKPSLQIMKSRFKPGTKILLKPPLFLRRSTVLVPGGTFNAALNKPTCLLLLGGLVEEALQDCHPSENIVCELLKKKLQVDELPIEWPVRKPESVKKEELLKKEEPVEMDEDDLILLNTISPPRLDVVQEPPIDLEEQQLLFEQQLMQEDLQMIEQAAETIPSVKPLPKVEPKPAQKRESLTPIHFRDLVQEPPFVVKEEQLQEDLQIINETVENVPPKMKPTVEYKPAQKRVSVTPVPEEFLLCAKQRVIKEEEAQVTNLANIFETITQADLKEGVEFRIRGRYKRNLEKLKIRDEKWTLKAEIADETGSISVALAESLLDQIVGVSAKEFLRRKNESLKMPEDLKRNVESSRERFNSLAGVMHLKFPITDSELPTLSQVDPF